MAALAPSCQDSGSRNSYGTSLQFLVINIGENMLFLLLHDFQATWVAWRLCACCFIVKSAGFRVPVSQMWKGFGRAIHVFSVADCGMKELVDSPSV